MPSVSAHPHTSSLPLGVVTRSSRPVDDTRTHDAVPAPSPLTVGDTSPTLCIWSADRPPAATPSEMPLERRVPRLAVVDTFMVPSDC